MENLIFNSVEELSKGVVVPAWTTVEYFDADGGLQAKYDVPRNYSKNCSVAHLNELKFPVTAKFTSHSPEEQYVHVDQDF